MKLDQLKQIMQLYSELLSPSEPSTAEKLFAMSNALDTVGAYTVKKVFTSTFINRAREVSKAKDSFNEGVAEALAKLAKLLELAGAKSSSDIFELSRIIGDDLGDSSVGFIAALTTPKPSSGKAQPLRLDIVRAYADELARTEGDSNAFDHAVARLRSDRNVRKQEVHAIANQFLGYRIKLGTKEKLLEKIINVQAKDVRQDVRSRSS